MRAIEVCAHVVEAQCVHRGVRGLLIEVAGVDHEDLPPRADLHRCYVRPRQTAVGSPVDQAVVRADPDDVRAQRRGADRVDHAALRDLHLILVFPDARRDVPRFSREVGRDLLPGETTVGRLPEEIVAEEQRLGVGLREHDGLRTHLTVRARAGRERFAGERADDGHLAGATIEARDGASAEDEVGVVGIGRDVPVFVHADGRPLTHRDLAPVAAARHARAAALLLPAAETIRKGVVCHHMV